MLDLDHVAETILQISQALQTVAEQGNHPDARAAALEHVKDSVCLLAERQ
jgi:hypothetical protein